mgnify:CR=1 FL=1
MRDTTSDSETTKTETDRSGADTRDSDPSTGASTAGPGGVARSLQRAAGNQAVKDLYRRGELQAKLDVSQPGDPAEREAEHVASEIVDSPDPTAEGESDVEIRRRASGAGQTAVDGRTEARIDALRGGGSPLSRSARSYFEPRFGRDFSDVRVHTGTEADAVARSIDAEAFTVGSDVAFASGRYRPGSPDGKRLIAHELAHVVQQGGGTTRASRQVIQREGGEETAQEDSGLFTEEQRVRMWNLALATISPALSGIISTMWFAGWSVNGGTVGVAGSAGGAPAIGGPAGGVGIEGLLFFDPADMEVTADAVPYAEIGAAVGGGFGGDVLLGLQAGPTSAAGGGEDYDGTSFSAELEAGIGVGVTVSKSLLTGSEGWVVFNVGLGAELGGALTLVRAKSGKDAVTDVADLLARALLAKLVPFLDAIGDAVETLDEAQRLMGKAKDHAMTSYADHQFRTWFPENWDLSGYGSQDAEMMQKMAEGMYGNLIEDMRDWNRRVENGTAEPASLREIRDYYEGLTLKQVLTMHDDYSELFARFRGVMHHRYRQVNPGESDSPLSVRNFWSEHTHEQFTTLAQNWGILSISDRDGSFAGEFE